MHCASSEIWHDPALPFVESRRACHSRACYKAHSHPTFSIGAVDVGFSRFSGAGKRQVRLTPGTLVLVPAQRVHACNPEPGTAWSYQMLHLDAQWLQQLRLEMGTPAADAGEPARIVRSVELYQHFCQLNALLFSDAGVAEKHAALVTFMGDHDFSAYPALEAAPIAPLGRSVLGQLIEHIEQAELAELSLDSLARQADLGRYQLIRAFRAATVLRPTLICSTPGSTGRGSCFAKVRNLPRWPTAWVSLIRAIFSGYSRPIRRLPQGITELLGRLYWGCCAALRGGSAPRQARSHRYSAKLKSSATPVGAGLPAGRTAAPRPHFSFAPPAPADGDPANHR